MKTYAILCHPQALKIYKQDASAILSSELKAVAEAADIKIQDAELKDIAGVSYLSFSCGNEPADVFISALARLSGFFALFEVRSDMLLPKQADAGYTFTQNMPALLNYQGKTNELFTRLMINLAQSVCAANTEGAKTLLDPVAGKGTTLYDAMMLGYNAVGIEQNSKYFEESGVFCTKFMQSERMKHTTRKEKIADDKARKIADAFTLEFAKDKKTLNSKDAGLFKIFAGDMRGAQKLIKRNSVDMMVGDLPYGVQHASRSSSGRARGAEQLVAEAMPGLSVLLKKGGSFVLSFNEYTTSKDNLGQILEKNGFIVLKKDEYSNYRHTVDSSIKRNLIAALKQ